MTPRSTFRSIRTVGAQPNSSVERQKTSKRNAEEKEEKEKPTIRERAHSETRTAVTASEGRGSCHRSTSSYAISKSISSTHLKRPSFGLTKVRVSKENEVSAIGRVGLLRVKHCLRPRLLSSALVSCTYICINHIIRKKVFKYGFFCCCCSKQLSQ